MKVWSGREVSQMSCGEEIINPKEVRLLYTMDVTAGEDTARVDRPLRVEDMR